MAAFCEVGSAQGVSGEGRAFLQWLKAEELFTGSHKMFGDDQIFAADASLTVLSDLVMIRRTGS